MPKQGPGSEKLKEGVPLFLRSPIPKERSLEVVCPGCGGTFWGVWSPTVTGVLVCPSPSCNTRLRN